MFAFSNHPSPRPGFTVVAREESKRAGTVVVVVSDHPGSLTALWRAAGEAAQRSAQLHVVDVGSGPGFEDVVHDQAGDAPDRWHSIAMTILRNPNVSISHLDLTGADDLIGYCRSAGASLLVVDADYFKDASQAGQQLAPLGGEPGVRCDLLIVNEDPTL